MKLLWQQIPSPMVSEILCDSREFDGVVLDTEHGMFNNETIFSCIQIITLRCQKCFVRVTRPDKTFVRQCLDAGADGIIFSTVEGVSDCLEMKNMCYYPPKGKRGLGLVRENLWGDAKVGYGADKDAPRLIRTWPTIVIAQIENKSGIDNLKDMVKMPEIDHFFIGPYDLSADLGCPGNFENPEFKKAMRKFEEIVPEKRRGFHIVNDITKGLSKYKDYGMLAVSMDTLMLKSRIKDIGRLINAEW